MNDVHDSGQNKGTIGRWRNPHSISAAQFAAIEAAAAADGVTFETEPAGEPPLFIWQKDHILVSDDVDEETQRELIELGARLAPNLDGSRQRRRKGMAKLLRLGKTGDETTRQIVDRLNRNDELTGKVFVNNLTYVTHEDGANLCPADEPTPVRAFPQTIPYPPPSRSNAGEGVRITVIDTGLSPGWEIDHPWLSTPANEVDGDVEITTFDTNGDIAPHAGHGMFIAGIIRCLAPRANVTVLNTMRWAGAMTEYEVARTIFDVLDSDTPPDCISFSAGFMLHEKGRAGDGPAAMLGVLRRLRSSKTVLVAATGNDGHGPADHGLFYPAAFAGQGDNAADGLVVAVGALRQDRQGRACFSNYGDWVTVYEEGEKLVNAFPVGKYTYREPLSAAVPPVCTYYPHLNPPLEPGCSCLSAPAQGSVAVFDGMASWSGTSFATPVVVGRLARHLSQNRRFAGQPREAMRDLLKQLVTITDAGDGKTALNVFPQPAAT